jgi:hypothetical protein
VADYIVQGKKGNGKSLICVSRMRETLLAGNTVATNLDLFLEYMLPPGTRNILVYRLPDKPTAEDLKMIGRGLPKGVVDESRYGSIFVDECATILNARTFNDKGRAEFLDYYVHSRKLSWHTYFICQNLVQIDKQVRESLADLVVTCKRLDRVRIPFIGVLSKNLLGFEIRPPKAHVATVKYGSGHEAMTSDRWLYTGTDLYKAYDTEQVFRNDYDSGVYCFLTPWHLSVNLVPPDKKFVGPIRPGKIDWIVKSGRVRERNRGSAVMKYLGVVLLLGIVLGVFGQRFYSSRHPAIPVSAVSVPGAVQSSDARKYSDVVHATGYFRNGPVITLMLSDGTSIRPKSFETVGAGWEAQLDNGLWVKGGDK